MRPGFRLHDFGTDPQDGGSPWDNSPFNPPIGIDGPPIDGAAPAQGGTSSGATVLYVADGGSGSAATAGGAGRGGATTVTTVTAAASPFVINITWDSSAASAPTAFKTAIINAVQYLESQFTDPVTINIDVGYGEVAGTSLGSSALGSSESYLSSYSYTALRNALASDATSADDASALASLAATAPVSGTFWTTTAEAKALGLAAATGSSLDGYIGFSSSLPFSYTDTGGVTAGTYDFNGVALHELTEVMGRMLLTGATVGSAQSSYDLLDLFHYSAAGVRDFSAGAPGYFSANGGSTSLGSFNTVSGGDAGDWASSVANDSFDAFSNSGVVNAVSTNDLRELDVLGWNRATQSAPAGISVAAVTTTLAASQGSSGLAANSALASLTATGGNAGDSFGFALGGAAAASFRLTVAGNRGTLSVGSAALAGANGGHLYAVTITPTDITTGSSGTASPLAVIVGGSGNDSINVATLTAALGRATPTFIEGLAGADTINGSGMTGALWFDAGAGADRMTGGSGVNDYLYGAVSDSTASAMDVISNFHVATDLIDLTGLGVHLAYAGSLTSSLAADTVGWQVSGGNTYIYVNASGSAETLTAPSMKIELAGSLSLGGGNILHA
jgi:hypothetical protein